MNAMRTRKAAPAGPTLRERAAVSRGDVARTFGQAGSVPSATPFSTTVEAELIALNERYQALQQIYDQVGATDLPASPVVKMALDHAEGHAVRLQRAALREAVGLPASSILALGLQARLIAAEASEWWDNESVNVPERLCRDLLDKMLGLAGLSRIRRPDVSIDELRGWLADPTTAPGAARLTEEAAR